MNRKVVFFTGRLAHSAFTCRLYKIFTLFVIFALSGCSLSRNKTKVPGTTSQSGASAATIQNSVSDEPNQISKFDGITWTSMFDGEKLGLWEKTDFYEKPTVS